jgi:hypothetical protein
VAAERPGGEMPPPRAADCLDNTVKLMIDVVI